VAKIRRKVAMPVIGWREWVGLPELGMDRIKAKIDTGARSSALHAFNVQMVEHGEVSRVRFDVQPTEDDDAMVTVETDLVEMRQVRNSGGGTEDRYVIHTPVSVLGQTWDIELTLTTRWEMGFRMLLGRQAVRNRFLVDPGRSFFGDRDELEKRVRQVKHPKPVKR
jgi:hypothetical protein